MTFATRLTKVGYGREHFDQRTWMCYHEFLLSEGVVTQVEDAEQAKPHRKHHPLSLFGAPEGFPIEGYRGPRWLRRWGLTLNDTVGPHA